MKLEKRKSVINPVRGDFNRIVNIFINIGGTISIVFENTEHETYLLEVEGTIRPMNELTVVSKQREDEDV